MKMLSPLLRGVRGGPNVRQSFTSFSSSSFPAFNSSSSASSPSYRSLYFVSIGHFQSTALHSGLKLYEIDVFIS